MAPKVFISYSHDSSEHRDWVLDFAKQLLHRGIDVILDRWDLHPGQLVPAFMAQSIEAADRVLVICTPRYAEKVNSAKGGAAYEGMIIDAAIADSLDTHKFIPILRAGSTRALPRFLQGRLYVSFEDDATFAESLTQVVHEIHGVPASAKPAVGPNPFQARGDEEQLDPALDIPSDRADRWQEDENLFRDARQSLQAREVIDFSASPQVRAALGLHKLRGGDLARQGLRLHYLNQVLTILQGTVGRREAVEIWLAGIDQHNQSLSHKVSQKSVLAHVKEVRLLYGHLASAASGIRDFEIRTQVERWLDITRHNMESMARHRAA